MYSSLPDMSPGQPHCSASSSSYNRNWLPSCAQKNNGDRREVDHIRVRRFMSQKIYDYLMLWHSDSYDAQAKRAHEVVKCLEEILFRSASSKEEYMNLETLTCRIELQLRCQTCHRKQFLQCNCASVSRMGPTSNGLHAMPTSFRETSMVSSSAGNSSVPTIFNSEGSMCKEHQGADCNMTGVSWSPDQMLSESTPTFNCNQLDMILENVSFCDGIALVESELTSELHAPQKPAQSQYIGGQNGFIIQGLCCPNDADVSFSLKYQTPEHLNGYRSTGVGNMDSNMLHANGLDMSEKKFIQMAYCEPDELNSGQHQPPGDRSDLCSTVPSLSGHECSLASMRVPVMSDWNSNSSIMQPRPKLGSNLMTYYFNLPLPEEAVDIQSHFIDRSANVPLDCSLPSSDISGQLCGSNVQMKSQLQPQQKQAHGLLQSTTRVNVHMKVNEVSCCYVAEYPHQSESQHQANENAQPMRVLHPDRLGLESETEHKYNAVGRQPKEVICSPQKKKADMSCQPSLQFETNNNVDNRDTNCMEEGSAEGSVASQTASIESIKKPLISRDATCMPKELIAKSNMKKYQFLLSMLLHARSCTASGEGKCPVAECEKAKTLLLHITNCKVISCSYPLCQHAKSLTIHFKHCRDPCCLLCAPAKNKIQQSKMLHTPSGLNSLQHDPNSASIAETYEDVHPPKRVKTHHSEVCILTAEKSLSGISTDCTSHSAGSPTTLNGQCEALPSLKHKLKKLNDGLHVNCKEDDPCLNTQTDSKIDVWPQDGASVDVLENMKQDNIELKVEHLDTSTKHAALPAELVSEPTANRKLDCVSLTELFTPEQVRQHVVSLRQWVGQSKVKTDKRQAMEQQSINQNSCQLCAAEELNFEPMPIYCTQCGSRIRRHGVYYWLGTGDARYYFCTTCHTAIRGENFILYGKTFSKSELEKKKNNEHTQEPWVQCDECHGWQHQICALFNSRMNGGGQAKYTCPNCYVTEIERGDRLPLPPIAFLGAKDLPRTNLSNHIEQRLHRRLKEERLERATAQALTDEKVPGAGALVVRVVLTVDKKLEVKKNFLDIFRENDYPAEFPYKSKVILLFQDIEGVEVCLFGMYVQEYGSECDFPNKRHIYISYLDSVKYFRPDVKVVTGVALRTFIYHELLIGYLEYCKNRGFTSCYIWACPPLKGEDYILYCHPEIQRCPKSDKLREWYLSMLRKAAKEDIVVGITNIYDQFLVSTGECNAKISTARLPYFDGDYWPGAAEEKLQQFCQDGDNAPSKSSTSKKFFTKRSLRATLQSDISDSASKDMFLIHEIGKAISPMKEDFIMVHLHHLCTHCCMFIISGNCWLCKQCSNFRLCDKCYDLEQCRDVRDRHPLQQKIKHLLYPVQILNVPSVTKDEDEIIESEIFDTRYAFLKLCQGNHYQYDTLRRAKHSSMMLLYHLHNPRAPAFVTMCNICHLDIEAGRGLRCEVCFEYEICSGCYEKHGGRDHPHKLTKCSSSHQAQSKEARALWALQVRKMNNLIVHVSDCHSPCCLYPDCRKVKVLFRHGTLCTKRALKGCLYCKKMWHLLQIHSRACQESECRVPRCSDLKTHARRKQQQSESRRRAAVAEMMRQRSAEIGSQS